MFDYSRIAVASYKEQEDYLHGIGHRPHIVQSISVTWEFFGVDLSPNITTFDHAISDVPYLHYYTRQKISVSFEVAEGTDHSKLRIWHARPNQ